MATTEAELDTVLQDFGALVHNLWAAQTVPADVETVQGSAEGRFAAVLVSAADAFRARTAEAIDVIEELVDAWISSYQQHVVQEPLRGSDLDFAAMQKHWRDNNKHVQTRGFSFGSPTADGGNTGDGTISRLTVDENGDPIESEVESVKTFVCTEDATGTADAHEEIFRAKDAAAAQDRLQLLGSGEDEEGGEFRAKSSASSLLSNSGFNTVDGLSDSDFSPSVAQITSSMTLRDWAFETDKTAHELDRSDVVEDGDDDPHSLVLKAADKITQALDGDINYDVPHHLAGWVKPDGSADNDITVVLGGKSYTFAVSGLTANQWNFIEIDLDKDRWPRNWNTAGASVSIEWDGTAGQVKLDAFKLVEMVRFPSAGTYYSIDPGETKFQEGDEFTLTDSISSDSKLQKLLAMTGRYLPSVANASQVTAAGGRTLTFADADPDTVTASSGDFTADGYEAGMKLVVAGTSNNDGTYLIASVTATVITLDAAEALTAEGPLSSTATLDGTPNVPDPS